MITWYDQPLEPLPAIYEIIGLAPPEVVTFRVSSWLLGSRTIHVPAAGGEVEKVMLGLDVVRLDRPSPHPQWAFSSVNLIAAMVPQLQNPATAGQVFTITTYGSKKSKHFQIEVSA